MIVMNRTRDDRGTLTRLTEGLYWFAIIDVLLVVTSAPAMIVWMLLAQDVSNLPLYAAALVVVLPSVSAALWAWRAWSEDPDPVPLARFLRGYRLNLLDSLKVGVPGLVVLTVLGTNISYGEAVGTSALNIAFALFAAMITVLMMRALSISSALSFRLIDVLRLSMFTLLTMPLRTLALFSLGILVVGISLFLGDYAFLFLASALTFVMHLSERPVIARLREQFVSDPEA